MIHKRSYLIPPETPRLSVAVCFPCASGNCSSVNTLGKMGSVILPLSISEMIFFLLLSGGKSVCCQTLLSQISKGIWRKKQKKKKVMKSPLTAPLNQKFRFFRGSWTRPPLSHLLSTTQSNFFCRCFFSSGVGSGWCVSTGSVPNKIKGSRKIWCVCSLGAFPDVTSLGRRRKPRPGDPASPSVFSLTPGDPLTGA